MKLQVINLDNKPVGDIELSQEIFGLIARVDILHRVVEWQRAKSRSGTHATKSIGQISGTTKKPYNQKGTGNARQGSLRSAQFRGGAVIFGPVVRDHGYSLPKKVRKLGLKMALSSKFADKKLYVIDEAKLDDAKTAVLAKKITALGLKSALFIDGDIVDKNMALAVQNIKRIDIMPFVGANVYDILRHDDLILTRQAVEKLEERLK